MPILIGIKKHWFVLVLIIVFSFSWLAFGRSLWQDFAAIDDSFLIVSNPIVHGLDWERIRLAFTTCDPELYIPLTLMSFQLNWLMGSGSSLPFHVTNILLHSMNSILVTVFVRRLFDVYHHSPRPGMAALWATVVGVLFAVHPLHTEAVVWAAGRKDLLATFFFLLTILSFQQCNLSAKNYRYLTLSLVAFLLGLLSKVLVATLPVVLLLYCALFPFFKAANTGSTVLTTGSSPLRRRPWVLVCQLLPFLALSVVFLWVSTFGKELILQSSSLWDTLVMAQKSAAFYLLKFFIPTGLTVIYPFQGTITLQSSEFFVPAIVNLGLIAIALWQYKKRPLLTFGILFYYITLAPTFFNFHKGDLFFFAVDRYAYIPSIGLLIAALSIIFEFFETLRIPARAGYLAMVVMSMAMIIVSFQQSKIWDTPDTLFGRSIDLYPESVSARMAIASVERERGNLEDAFRVLKTGLAYSDHPGLSLEAGLIYSANGQLKDAREQFALALKKDADLPPALFYMGFLDQHEGKTESAISWYRKAVESDPSYVTARVHLAMLLMRKKENEPARQQLDQALQWNPVSLEAVDGMIALENQRGNIASAQQWLQRKSWMSP